MSRDAMIGQVESPRPAEPAPAWGVFEMVMAILVAMIMASIASLALSALLDTRPEQTVTAWGALVQVLIQIMLDTVIVGVAALLSLGRYRLPARAWGLRRKRPLSVVNVAGTTAGAFLIMVGYVTLVRWAGWDVLDPKPNVPAAMFNYATVLPFAAFLLVIVAPLAEEMFFRGFIFGGLRRRLGLPVAALTSGLLWSVIHGQVGLVIPIAGIGVLFALVFAATGSLWNAIAAHLVFNLVSMIATLTSR